MKTIRKRALITCINQFILFSCIGFCLILMLFPVNYFAFPFIAFLWTFCGFNAFTFIFAVEVKHGFKFSFAFLNFCVVGLALLYILNLEFKNENASTVFFAGVIATGFLYFILSVLFLIKHFVPATDELKRVIDPEKYADERETLCKTKYPVFLVHGTGFRDRLLFNYWSWIPGLLKDSGAQIFYSKHDAWASVEDSAEQIVTGLKKALSESGAEKVNVIAHSKGGIDMRYAMEKLGIKDNIASITMISSPNHGSETVEKLYRMFGDGLFKFISLFVNVWFRILGDKKPDFYRTTSQFRSSFMEKFNAEFPLPENIPVQTFAGKMKSPFSDLFMFFLNIVVGLVEGPNDGLVSVESAQFGNYRGVIEANGLSGISHAQEVDAYRSNPKLKVHEGLPEGSKTIHDFYIGIVRELKEKGL